MAQITCPYCGGSQFSFVDDGWFRVNTSSKKGLGNVWRARFNFRVCMQCGHTALFAHPGPIELTGDVTCRRAP